jgi:hypothetical protein
MWDPQRLTTLWAFMACYRDSFTFTFTFTFTLSLRWIWLLILIKLCFQQLGQVESNVILFILSYVILLTFLPHKWLLRKISNLGLLSGCIDSFLSMALPALSGPRPLIHFLNHFSQTVGLLVRVISPSQGRYLNKGLHKHRMNTYTHQTPMLCVGFARTIPAFEDSSCLRLRRYCDRLHQQLLQLYNQ